MTFLFIDSCYFAPVCETWSTQQPLKPGRQLSIIAASRYAESSLGLGRVSLSSSFTINVWHSRRHWYPLKITRHSLRRNYFDHFIRQIIFDNLVIYHYEIYIFNNTKKILLTKNLYARFKMFKMSINLFFDICFK